MNMITRLKKNLQKNKEEEYEIGSYVYRNTYKRQQPLFSHTDWIQDVSKEIPEYFDQYRLDTENENTICNLIRQDSIENFIVLFTKKGLTANNKIQNSIYETKSFLLKQNNISLIEYAAFFGSIQVFQFLQINGADLKPSLWMFSIHGKNAEIIHFL